MATTLVIRNANFLANKIDTVSFENIPCTGISLSDVTKSFSSIGTTYTLIATVTPADTTDALIWSSSNTNVVTVSDGVITAVGIGEATITATCGGYSATCTVAVTVAYSPSWVIGYQATQASTGNVPPEKYLSQMVLSSAAIGVSSTGQYPLYNSNNANYPYLIPQGATKISVSAQDCYIGCWFSDSSIAGYSTYASAISGNNASSSAGIADSYTYTVPEDADSFVLIIRLKSGTITQSDLNNVTVTFLTE